MLGGIGLSVSAGLGSTATSGVESPVLVTNAKSILFDGIDEYIDTGYSLGTSSACTISFWMKDASLNTGDNYVDNRDSASDGITFFISNTDKMTFRVNGNDIESTNSLSTDWNHVVGVFDGSGNTKKIYINNTETSASETSSLNISGNLRIGARSYSIRNYAVGNIDEVAIWNSALTATEIEAIYDNVRLDFTKDSVGYASSSNLVGWWRMGDEADTRVADNNANNLIVPDMRKTFFTGKSIDFDGSDDYINCGADFRSITEGGTRTISAWVKASNTDPTDENDRGRIFSIYKANDNSSFAIHAEGSSAPANWHYMYRSTGDSFNSVDSGVNVTTNWTHLALTQNGANLKFYINGVEEDSKTDATYVWSASRPAIIGGHLNSTGQSQEFNGKITDVAIWNAELNADTITSIYNSGEPNDLTLAASYTAGSGVDKTSNLQGYWRMGNASDDSYSTIQDQTSNNNDGTMTNMSAYDIVEHAPNRHSGDMIGFDATSDIEDDVKT